MLTIPKYENQNNKLEIQVYERLQDPVFFIKEILGVERLTKDQIKVIRALWKNKYVGVKAAHGVGKTFLSAAITLAYLYSHPNTIVITTAPTMRQVRDLLWSELSHLYNRARYPLGGELLQVRLRLDAKWYAEGIATDPGKEDVSATKIQGYHGEKLLVIIDEAVGVHPTIWEAIDGITSSRESKILAIGNPSTSNCMFYKKLREHDWYEMQISALNHPNVKFQKEIIKGAVDYKWVKEKVRKWCSYVGKHNEKWKTFEFNGVIYKPNTLFLWKVLGEFPLDDMDKLIPIEKIENAMNRAKIIGLENEIRDMAIDVARVNDASCIAINIGNNYEVFRYYLKTEELLSEIVNKIVTYKPYRVGVDCDGIGGAIYDLLNNMRDNHQIKDKHGKEVEFELVEIRGSASPILFEDSKEKFANFRSQMYSLFANDIDYIKLPQDDDLEEELNAPMMKQDRFGKNLLEPKDVIRQRIGRSPDSADAVVYCNALKYIEEKSDIKFAFID